MSSSLTKYYRRAPSGRARAIERSVRYPPSRTAVTFGVALAICILTLASQVFYLEHQDPGRAASSYEYPPTPTGGGSDNGLRSKAPLQSSSSMDASYSHIHRKEKTCIITISAWNMFGFVRVLHDTVARSNPSLTCFIWFVSDAPAANAHDDQAAIDNILEEAGEDIEIVTLDALSEGLSVDGGYNLREAAFKYSRKELACAIKPLAFLYAFQRTNASSVIYFDNDIWVSGSLLELQHLLHKYSVVVTPHITEPVPEDGKNQRDSDLLRAGVYNFGFVAFRKSQTAIKYLLWWQARLRYYGFGDGGVQSQGFFYDQVWSDFIPAFFDSSDYHVLRDIRYNVAYWNLHYTGKRLLFDQGFPEIQTMQGERETVVFMHFSGMSLFDTYNSHDISPYQTRYTGSDFPIFLKIAAAYTKMLQQYQTDKYVKISYGFSSFGNGMEIKQYMRDLYASAVYTTSNGNVWEEIHPFYGGFQPLVLEPSIKFFFHRDVHPDPFCVSLSNPNCHNPQKKGQEFVATFTDWLLGGAYTNSAVDMEGDFYFSELEVQIWKMRPDLQELFPDPRANNHAAFKAWFQMSSVSEGMLDKRMFELWRLRWKESKGKSPSEDIGVNVFGWHSSLVGIGRAAALYARSFADLGITTNAIDLPRLGVHKHEDPTQLLGTALFTRSATMPINIFASNANMYPHFLEWIPGHLWAKINVGIWAWELDAFPSTWMEHLRAFDEIWVSSTYIATSLKNTPGYDLTPVRVLPIPFEVSEVQLLGPNQPIDFARASIDLPSDTFLFLVVFDFSSTITRKNPAAAIRAFSSAFPRGADPKIRPVHLVVKLINSHHFPDDLQELRTIAGNDPRITFITDTIPVEDNKALKLRADCYVSLHRSEGYGLNILESMFLGTPTIATNYSGNVDFFSVIPEQHGSCHYPISYKLIEVADEHGPYSGFDGVFHWAEPDHSEAVAAMRSVVRADCSSLSEATFETLSSHFGEKAVGRLAQGYISKIAPKKNKKRIVTKKTSVGRLAQGYISKIAKKKTLII